MWKVKALVWNNRVYELPVVWAYGRVPLAWLFALLLTESLKNGPHQ